MIKQPTRICIKTKDISRIVGCSDRHSRNVINDIRVFYKKQKHQPVTIHEFSKHMDIPLEQIEPYLI